ncbi:MAG TPA: hypothetical protein VM865_05105 [Acidobacteriaceae bacterium]|jgi:hypothetical protein|nr:hypothetical protein [Acidobacteriaceae bacterium]
MGKLTIGFGVALIVLGVASFVLTGSTHPTALIPVWFGIALAVCGALAITEDARRRMLWMHIAVTLGLLGFLFPGIRGAIALAKAHASGVELAAGTANAVHEQLAMAVLCLVFTGLCVRSFIAARRNRTA